MSNSNSYVESWKMSTLVGYNGFRVGLEPAYQEAYLHLLVRAITRLDVTKPNVYVSILGAMSIMPLGYIVPVTTVAQKRAVSRGLLLTLVGEALE